MKRHIAPCCINVDAVRMEANKGQKIRDDGYLKRDAQPSKQQQYFECEIQKRLQEY